MDFKSMLMDLAEAQADKVKDDLGAVLADVEEEEAVH